ncbi:hypothetical protein B9Z55_023257 [Caenorhabditis nigoni]|uniref:Uncharacterized protein n=1 Tax=Caenorhabditis nigoni TaxID=1611254 RepID=A0A2G5SPL0_9PELO|nr:hypothetical protein B9Z55_023257 [Caenorhabditis nigoni]
MFQLVKWLNTCLEDMSFPNRGQHDVMTYCENEQPRSLQSQRSRVREEDEDDAPQLHQLAAMTDKHIWSCHQGPMCSICDAKIVGSTWASRCAGLAMPNQGRGLPNAQQNMMAGGLPNRHGLPRQRDGIPAESQQNLFAGYFAGTPRPPGIPSMMPNQGHGPAAQPNLRLGAEVLPPGLPILPMADMPRPAPPMMPNQKNGVAQPNLQRDMSRLGTDPRVFSSNRDVVVRDCDAEEEENEESEDVDDDEDIKDAKENENGME